MKLGYKFRLFPNKSQELLLKQYAGQCRFIWNYYLAKSIEQYKINKHFIFSDTSSVHLTQLKKEPKYKWLNICPSESLQQKLRDLDKALKGIGKNNKGFPKFKKKSSYSDSFRVVNMSLNKDNFKVKLPKIGYIRYDGHRDLPSKPSSATISQNGDKWYISFTIEKEELSPVIPQTFVGIDLGIKSFLTTSDGEYKDNPKFGNKLSKKLKRKQKQLSRRKKGSNNRKKKQLLVRNIHNKIKNQRKDYLHKVSNQITNDYDLICVESLSVKNMVKNRKLSKAISDIGWSNFVNFLLYKSKLKGKTLIQIDKFYPSSKICSSCGNKKHKLSLSERIYECSNCNISIDRDVNASINILNEGYRMYNVRQGMSEQVIGNNLPITNACGDTSDGVITYSNNSHVSMIQEYSPLFGE